MTAESLATLQRTLTRAEGRRLTSYLDTTGNITIGVGHNITGRGITITNALSDKLLAEDIAEAWSTLVLVLPWVAGLDEVRQQAFCELSFNLGIKKLLTFVRTLSYARAGQWDEAADQLLESRWAVQVGPTRSGRLAAMVRTGQQP